MAITPVSVLGRVEALETKVGSGISAPTDGTTLVGASDGESSWEPTEDIEPSDAALGSGTPTDYRFLRGDRSWATVHRFDVREYGAVGDGETDDLEAINDAILAAFTSGGGVVFFPAGTYLTSLHIGLRSNVHLRGEGIGVSTIQLDSSVAANVFEGDTADHFSIKGLTIDQNFGGGGTSGSGMILEICSNFDISENEVKNTSNNGISIDSGCHDGTVYGNILNAIGKVGSMVGSGFHGIGTSGGDDGGVERVAVIGNVIKNMEGSGVNLSHAIHCTAVGNTIWRDTRDAEGYGGVRLSNSATFCTVIGNTIHNPSRGVFVASTALEGNVVSGNTIVGASAAGVLCEASGAVISNNYIKNCNLDSAEGAVRLSDALRCTVSGNTIYDDQGTKTHTYGIQESGTSDNNIIAGNNIVGVLTARYAIVGASTMVQDPFGITGKETVFNEDGVDQDFRIESIDRAFMFMIDAGLNAVGIGTTAFGNIADFRNTIITFNNAASDIDVRMLGDTDTNLFRLDASTDRVGIGTGTPGEKFDVTGNIRGSGSILTTGATTGVGYATGAGGTVTQLTSKATGVTLSKPSGQITMHNAALAAATIVSFVLTNTAIAAGDVVVLNHLSGGTIGSYTLNAQSAAGSATINVRNNTAGSLGEALVIAFAVVKAVTS